MPDSKITDLSAIVTVVDADVLPIVDISDDTTKKVTIAQIKATAPVQSVNGSTGSSIGSTYFGKRYKYKNH
jgi:hypothetical protein